MERYFPNTHAGELSDMGDEQEKKHSLLDWAKLITQIVGIGTICILLVSLGQRIQGWQNEAAGLNRTVNKILEIYQRNEDAGRAAIQSQIEQLEMQLTPYTPAQRRKKTEEQIRALKDKLKISKENSAEFAGGGVAPDGR